MSQWLENKQYRQYAIYLLYWQIYFVRMDFRWVMVAPKSLAQNRQTLFPFFRWRKRERETKSLFQSKFSVNIQHSIHQYQHFESMTGKILIDSCYCCLFVQWSFWFTFQNFMNGAEAQTHKHTILCVHCHYSWHNFYAIHILLALEWKHLNMLNIVVAHWIRHNDFMLPQSLPLPLAQSIFSVSSF